jgi:MYXO-CTERM domain-containing protein
MNRLCSAAVVATVVVVLRADARACDPVGDFPHTVDPSMQAADQTPPSLPAIPAPTVHYGADDSSGCGGAKCGDATYIGIAALATDDMTAADHIGYRLSLVDGTLPANTTLPTTAIDPFLDQVRVYFPHDTVAFDFTLQVVAIDRAGNESAPQTVRVTDDSGHACAVARGRAGRTDLGWAALLALLAVASRQRRR